MEYGNERGRHDRTDYHRRERYDTKRKGNESYTDFVERRMVSRETLKPRKTIWEEVSDNDYFKKKKHKKEEDKNRQEQSLTEKNPTLEIKNTETLQNGSKEEDMPQIKGNNEEIFIKDDYSGLSSIESGALSDQEEALISPKKSKKKNKKLTKNALDQFNSSSSESQISPSQTSSDRSISDEAVSSDSSVAKKSRSKKHHHKKSSKKKRKHSKKRKEKKKKKVILTNSSKTPADSTTKYLQLKLTCAQPSDEESSDPQINPQEGDFTVGPMPINMDAIAGHSSKYSKNLYGKVLLPNEAIMMAQYVEKGKRIPRRGEVGLAAEEIESYEKLGYVMSGSRNKRMNMVRLKKENQIYSAEEKKALALLNFEEQQKKEQQVITDMKQLLQSQIKK